jgi:hypothetical protein
MESELSSRVSTKEEDLRHHLDCIFEFIIIVIVKLNLIANNVLQTVNASRKLAHGIVTGVPRHLPHGIERAEAHPLAKFSWL